jgi:hypothetical protein
MMIQVMLLTSFVPRVLGRPHSGLIATAPRSPDLAD